MSAHTSGPWNYGQVKENPIFDIIGPDLTGRGREVVGTFRASQCRVANLANARLISAGPELLSACKYLLENADAAGWSEFMVADARAAIAKAEGRAE